MAMVMALCRSPVANHPADERKKCRDMHDWRVERRGAVSDPPIAGPTLLAASIIRIISARNELPAFAVATSVSGPVKVQRTRADRRSTVAVAARSHRRPAQRQAGITACSRFAIKRAHVHRRQA